MLYAPHNSAILQQANEVAVLEGETWKKVDMTNLHNK